MNSISHEIAVEEILMQEIELLSVVSCCQSDMRESIRQRDWVATEHVQRRLSEVSEHFVALDEKLYDALCSAFEWGHETVDFYNYTKKIRPKSRIRLNMLYRDLQNKMQLAKAENESFATYVNHVRSLIHSMVDTFTNDKKTRSYTPRGAPVTSEMSNMVLDKVL